MGVPKYQEGFGLTLHPECLSEPLEWKRSHTIFVCSMSDLFHEDVPFAFIEEVMQVIEKTPQHRYQLLTKRAEIMSEFFNKRGSVPANAWLGVTVENQKEKYRIEYLRKITASVRFLSCEPLLGDLGYLDLRGIDWVIVGGESGRQARPMKGEWALNIQAQAKEQDAAFFFKQWGTWGSDGVKRNKHANGKVLNGRVVQEMPVN